MLCGVPTPISYVRCPHPNMACTQIRNVQCPHLNKVCAVSPPFSISVFCAVSPTLCHIWLCLDSKQSWESGKFQLVRWSHRCILQTRNLALRLNSQNRLKMMEFDTEEKILGFFQLQTLNLTTRRIELCSKKMRSYPQSWCGHFLRHHHFLWGGEAKWGHPKKSLNRL